MGKHLKKKREYSKLISAIAIALWVLVNLYSMIVMIVAMDLSPIMYVVGSVDAVVAVVYTVYAHKAKGENKIKLMIVLIETLIKLKVAYGEDAAFVIQNIVGKQEMHDDDEIDFDMPTLKF